MKAIHWRITATYHSEKKLNLRRRPPARPTSSHPDFAILKDGLKKTNKQTKKQTKKNKKNKQTNKQKKKKKKNSKSPKVYFYFIRV